jgi:hypothetical protein
LTLLPVVTALAGTLSHSPIRPSDRDPLDLIERQLIPASVVELGGPGRLVAGHPLAFFSVPLLIRMLVIPVARKLWQRTGVLTTDFRARRWIIFKAAYRITGLVESTSVLPIAEQNRDSRFWSAIPPTWS